MSEENKSQQDRCGLDSSRNENMLENRISSPMVQASSVIPVVYPTAYIPPTLNSGTNAQTGPHHVPAPLHPPSSSPLPSKYPPYHPSTTCTDSPYKSTSSINLDKNEIKEEEQSIDEKSLTMLENFFTPKYDNRLKRKQKQENVQRNDGNVSNANFYEAPQSDDEYMKNNGTWPLPPGWTIITDASDGRMYYFHSESGITRWTHPNVPITHSHHSSFEMDKHSEENKSKTWKEKCIQVAAPLLPPSLNLSSRKSKSEKRKNKRKYLQDHQDNESHNDDNPINYHNTGLSWWKRPDSHQCYACVSLILCPIPMGCCAMYHSKMVNQRWGEGRHGDALDHSRQANNYACWGTVFAAGFWIYWYFYIREGAEGWHWPDWDWNFD